MVYVCLPADVLAPLGACRIAHALQENLEEMFLTKTVICIVCLILAKVQCSAAIDGALGEERGNIQQSVRYG